MRLARPEDTVSSPCIHSRAFRKRTTYHLVLGRIADEALVVIEANVRGRRAVALVVRNNLDPVVLPDTHAGVRGAEVDTDARSLRHLLCVCVCVSLRLRVLSRSRLSLALTRSRRGRRRPLNARGCEPPDISDVSSKYKNYITN